MAVAGDDVEVVYESRGRPAQFGHPQRAIHVRSGHDLDPPISREDELFSGRIDIERRSLRRPSRPTWYRRIQRSVGHRHHHRTTGHGNVNR